MKNLSNTIRKGELTVDDLYSRWGKLIRGNHYNEVHAKRFSLTASMVGPELPDVPAGGEIVGLNLGGHHLLDSVLEVAGVRFVSTDFDLRLDWPPLPKFKVILCTEVLEHLSDRPETDIEEVAKFKRSGLHSCLANIAAHLEDDGKAFFTTPNCASYESLRRWLGRESAIAYEGHFREYAYLEILREARKCGLEIVKAGTWFCYYKPEERIVKMVESAGPEWHQHRGDTTWFVAKKALQS